jgi:hypothetical protein
VVGNVTGPGRVKDTFDGAAAKVAILSVAPLGPPTPAVAVIVVASVAKLLGEKDDVAFPVEPVEVEVGTSVAVKPVVGAVVTLKLIGTPGWPVVSVAVMVNAAPPAVKDVEEVAAVIIVVAARS